SGVLRIAEKQNGQWQVREWLKKAVLLLFRLHENQVLDDGVTRHFDKVPLKYAAYDTAALRRDGPRLVRAAMVGAGAQIASDVVLMACYVNVGAYIGAGSMIDTWATVGSWAQVGRNVHISGGAGIGGVLEPLPGSPAIIEDNCFIGARSEVV